jgi:ribosomal subunit interface protein
VTRSAFNPLQKLVMQVRISGKQMRLGETLPAGVRVRLEEAVAKHFDGGANAHIVFSIEGSRFRADCTLHLDSKMIMVSMGEGPDAHRAFDAAFDHLDKQLRRYKRKLKNHHGRARKRVAA